MQSRCCCPPERPRADFLRRSLTSSHNAAPRRACSTRSSMSPRRPSFLGAKATFRRSTWGTGSAAGTPCRSAAAPPPRPRSAPYKSTPWYRICPPTLTPGTRSFIRFRQRMNVLLPQPEGPIIAVIRFLRMSRLTPARASDDPYETLRSRTPKTTSRHGLRVVSPPLMFAERSTDVGPDVDDDMWTSLRRRPGPAGFWRCEHLVAIR